MAPAVSKEYITRYFLLHAGHSLVPLFSILNRRIIYLDFCKQKLNSKSKLFSILQVFLHTGQVELWKGIESGRSKHIGTMQLTVFSGNKSAIVGPNSTKTDSKRLFATGLPATERRFSGHKP